ncbi:MAG: TonB-dependent receptor [Pseudomonadota bacterium]
MKLTNKLAVSSAVLAIVAAAPAAVMAQSISGAVRGVVTDTAGAPISGATVIVTDVLTGTTRTVTTGSGGAYNVRGLNVGGQYTISVSAAGSRGEAVEGIGLTVGDTVVVNFDLEQVTGDRIVVTASRNNTIDVATGPSATFGLDDLQNLPAINRDIRDIIRTDPRVFIDESFVDSVNCVGSNPRFNSLTIDGARLNDGFGLNSNGFPTERIPFSFDSIEQVAVELAPFDVFYGGFSACNINAVTKSGTNEFHGGFFVDYTSDALRGDSLEGSSVPNPDFDEYRYGFTLSGPIIKDKLFFFGSYEKLEGTEIFERGPAGSGAINEVLGLTQSDLDLIRQTAIDLYQYDPGVVPESADEEDEKILVKIDWNITDRQRLSVTYNYNDGFNITESDGDADEFEFSNHLYERGAELNAYSGTLFSDWTDNFSTEIRFSYVDLDNRQIPLGGTAFGEFQIDTENGANEATVYLGADDSRHANKLEYEIFTTVLRGFYTVRNHNFSFGFERETLDVFNVFVQESQGEYRFGSVADFVAGEPFRIEYKNAPSQDPFDAAAEFAFSTNSIYGQDEWNIDSYGLTLTVGLRYDFYTSDDTPNENAEFVSDFGFSNADNLDGAGLLQPRFGFNWEANDRLTVRGGIGRFSGGNPNVWLSNNYSNDLILQGGVRDTDVGIGGVNLFDLTYVLNEPGTPAGPGYGIPQEMADAVATGVGLRNFELNALDPDFEIPSAWKLSLGATYVAELALGDGLINALFGGEYVLNADFLYDRLVDSAFIERLDLEPAGANLAGLPNFDSPGLDSFLLTNADDVAEAFNYSFTIQKDYDNGFDWTLGYAYSDSDDINPMTSSVAFSNYNNRAFVNPNDSTVSQESNYNIDHRITVQANLRKDFFNTGLDTKVSLFGEIRSGLPYSFTFNNSQLFNFTPFLGNGADSVLLYVPEGGQLTVNPDGVTTNDPAINVGAGFDVDAFNAFLLDNDLTEFAGGFVEPNSQNSDWFNKWDIRIAQELPGIPNVFEDDRAEVFFIIENVGNLINDEWGVLYQRNFPGTVGVVDASNNGTNFTYNTFRNQAQQSRIGDVSLWSIRVGFKYDF